MPRADGSAEETHKQSSGWTFDPAVLLQLGKVMLEALVLGLCLLGLSVLRSRPCVRI